jgi:hypothetical protein
MVSFGLMLLSSGTASAVVIRSPIEAFGPDGTSASSFKNPRDLAFNQATRGLYAVDGGAPGVFGFDVSAPPAHTPLAGFSPLGTVPTGDDPGLAVDNTALPSSGNVYLVSEAFGTLEVYGFDASGAPLGGNFPIDPAITPGAPAGAPKDLCGAAVDSAGNVWVANFSTQNILEYSSAGAYKGSVSVAGQGFRPCSIAFDSNDDMYLTDGGSTFTLTYKYTAASGYTAATLIDSSSSRANAVDRSNHHVFVIQNVNAIREFDAAGNPVSVTSEKDSTGDMVIPTAAGPAGVSFRGVTVDSANDRVYASDGGTGKVRAFGPALTYPDLTIGTASGVENTSVTLNGTVSAQGVALSDCHFEYINLFVASSFDDLSSGGSVPCSPAAGSIPADSAAHPVSATLSGLAPNTSYRFRLVAANANGPITTPSSEAFETAGAPIVETTGAPAKTTDSAFLGGRVDPAGEPTTYRFEYGTEGPCDSSPCTSTPTRSLGPDEAQEITIKASAGLFKLGFGPDTTPELPFNASAAEVQSALQALPSIGAGNVTVTGGPGDLSGSHPYLATFGGELAATDVEGIAVQSGAGKNALSSPHSATITTTQEGGGGFNEAQGIAVAATGGQYKLAFGPDTSADIAFNAPAATVASSLEALPSIGAGNVVVSGGPGDATGSHPYVVHFVGALANANVSQLSAPSGTTPLSGTTELGAQTTVPGGVSSESLLVAARLEGLAPSTTYHYRVIADNGNSAGPQFGEDMTVTTFGEEAPLSHGHFPGPAGSDRAWELVSEPDSGGNPLGGGLSGQPTGAISDAGDRAVYGVSGGTPLSESGTFATRLYAERTASGWQTKKIYPPREEATASEWYRPSGPSDLSTMFAENFPPVNGQEFSIWRTAPNAPPVKLFSNPDSSNKGPFLGASNDGSRVLTTLRGSEDPAHPATPGTVNLYDITSGGTPQLASLLPSGSVPSCGVVNGSNGSAGLSFEDARSMRWVSPDGSLAFFPSKGDDCDGPQRLYVRDFGAEATKLMSPPPVSGGECNSLFITSIDGSAYFYTQSRLVGKDTQPTNCEGRGSGDVYRYSVGDEALECITCVTPGFSADIDPGIGGSNIGWAIGIAEDGSRVYFTSFHRLLPGASQEKKGIYRLDVASGELAYVANFGYIGSAGEATMSADGSIVFFRSDDPALNSPGGQQNDGTAQYYRYDDHDRSLACVSCPLDGSLPRGPVKQMGDAGPGANTLPLDADGGIFAFVTPTSLVGADQNTAAAGQEARVGADAYEWRQGHLLLVSDGLAKWPEGGGGPSVEGITPSGHDIFFSAAAQYTQDALDGYTRLYDARIGGGFEFPRPPKPCPLEVCQGTPKGAPEEAAPGTATIAGVGNAPGASRAACAKPKRKVRKAGKTRCVKPARKKQHRSKQANHKRRAQR